MDWPNLEDMDAAADLVYRHMPASAQIEWPLLAERCGCSVVVKHENHNPTGAFKVRGGLVYLHRLCAGDTRPPGLIAATRGNHGQSIALAAAQNDLSCTVVVPEGNNPDKNRAMAAFGARLLVHGADFDEALRYARELSAEQGLHMVPSFHRDLVLGVGSYGLELMRARPKLARIYVPIGLGSGLCGLLAARRALGRSVEIVGVVSTEADCYAQSLAARRCIATETADTLADGMAVRVPNPAALDLMLDEVERIVAVDDEQVMAAMAVLFQDTHNVVEGAGAAALAALISERELNAGQDVAVIASGGNVDAQLYARILSAA